MTPSSYAPDYREIADRLRHARVVAVQNHLGSGTLFLASLLDGHPDVLMLPGILMHSLHGFLVTSGARTLMEAVDKFMAEYAHLFGRPHRILRDHGLDALGPNRDMTIAVHPIVFRRHLEQILVHMAAGDRPAFIRAVYGAYALTLGRSISRTPRIVHPLHSRPAPIAALVHADFPDASYLYMVRHPVSLFVSGIRHIANLPFNPVKATLRQLFLNFTEHGGNHAPFGDRPYAPDLAPRCRAFTLEALHEQPRETLQAICKFIGIAWDDALLTSTFNGLAWWNRAESPRLSGFDRSIPARGVATSTTWIDRLVLSLIALPQLRKWNYPDERRLRWAVTPIAAVIVALLGWLPFKLEWRWPHPKRVAKWRAARAANTPDWLARLILWFADYGQTRAVVWRSFLATRRDRDVLVAVDQ